MLRMAGCEVDSAERGENGEFVLRGVRYENASVEVSVSEFRSPMPLPLLWHGWRGSAAEAGTIRAEGLELRWYRSADETRNEESVPGPGEVLEEIQRGLMLADRWLPPVIGKDFSLVPPDDQPPYHLKDVSFRGRQLKAELEARDDLPAFRIDAGFPVDQAWTFQAEIDAWNLVLQGKLNDKTSVPRWEGELVRGSGTGSYLLRWEEDSWIPSEAALSLENFQIPEGMAGIPEALEPIRIESLNLEWDGTSYAGETRLKAGLAAEELAADLSLGGDFDSVEIQTLQLRGSWIRLNLGEPVRLDLKTWKPESPFRFSAFAELAGQDYYPARGVLSGTLETSFEIDGNFPVRFMLSGKNLHADGRSVRSVDLEGTLNFPNLALDALRISLPQGSVAEASGGVNLEKQTLALQLQGDMQAADLDAMAGRATGLDGLLHLEAEISGPWNKPLHGGSLRIGKFTPPEAVPLAIDLKWQGEGADKLTTDLEADTGEESVRLRSGWFRQGKVVRVNVEELKWLKSGRPFLALAEPAEVRLDGAHLAEWPWKGLAVDEIALTGDDRKLSLSWSPPVSASLQVNGLHATDLSGWLSRKEPLPDLFLEKASLTVEDLEPVLIAKADIRGSWRPGSDAASFTSRMRVRSDAAGVAVEGINVAYGETPLLAGDLSLPVTLHPWIFTASEPDESSESKEDAVPVDDSLGRAAGKGSFWKIPADGKLGGSLSGKWSPELRDQIQEWGGPSLEKADLELSLEGTVQKPEARLALNLDSMVLEEEWVGEDFPKVRSLAIDLVVNAEKILLKKGLLELRDSGIRFTGELPYPDLLSEFQDEEKPDLLKWLDSLRADAELRNWNAGVWKDRLPVLFRPQGKITGTLGVDPGLQMRGELQVSDFAVRPTLYSSPIDNIHATMNFQGRHVRLHNAGASVGGGTLSASGTLNLENWSDPRYEFKVSGKNVPVVRTTDMILRTDADLTFALAEGEKTPLVQGDLNLRNSTYLINFDPFAPNIETGPGNRPPYFSVTEEPFAGWRLDLTITGQDFLRVRSSLFTTELSAGLRLTRTLRNPLLLGSVRATSGRIRFPGMSMRIESLEAFVTPEEPNLLQIEADAIGQNRLYVVTLNASGSTESPQIQFSSTPTLSNAQIVRLLATGSLEGGGAGAIGLYLGKALMGPGTGEETLADRLSVEIGQEVTENGRSTVEVTYRLTDRWSLEGDYDRYDTYNVNLVRILLER